MVRPAGTPRTVIVIPAYNCEASIGWVVQRCASLGLQVVVVDDGSTDDTAAEARRAGAHQLLQHPHNLGKGHAMWTGFNWAMEHGAAFMVTLDGDGQHDPAELPGLLRLLPQCDVVIGQRRLHPEQMPKSRLTGNLISNFWISLFAGRYFPDTQCGYRIYSRRLLQRIPACPGRFETETEILLRAHRLGLVVRWTPISTIYDTGLAPHRTNYITLDDTLKVIRVVLNSPWFPRG